LNTSTELSVTEGVAALCNNNLWLTNLQRTTYRLTT